MAHNDRQRRRLIPNHRRTANPRSAASVPGSIKAACLPLRAPLGCGAQRDIARLAHPLGGPRCCETPWRLADWAGALAVRGKRSRRSPCPRATGPAALAHFRTAGGIRARRPSRPRPSGAHLTDFPSPPPSESYRRMACGSGSSRAVASPLRVQQVSIVRDLWHLFGRGEKRRAIKLTPQRRGTPSER
jgi:hypothetical protein